VLPISHAQEGRQTGHGTMQFGSMGVKWNTRARVYDSASLNVLISYGWKGRVFHPDVSNDRCNAALLLDIGP
jgi:hypothetical protein